MAQPAQHAWFWLMKGAQYTARALLFGNGL